MKKRAVMILALALVLGGTAAFLAFQYLRGPAGPRTAQAAPIETVEVLVAARDMKMGTVLAPEDVGRVRWPGDAVPAGYSADPSEVVGRGLLTPVSANEPLLSTKLARKEAGGGLAITIPEGSRAMSVKVDDVISVAGFVVPGSRVDVLATLDQAARLSEPTTRVILQNVPVAAADQQVQKDPQGEPVTVSVVTLVVTPEQGEKLALVASKGTIQLALRNSLDLAEVETTGVRPDELVRRPVVRSAYRPRAPRQVTVEVYRGEEKSQSSVERSPSPTPPQPDKEGGRQ